MVVMLVENYLDQQIVITPSDPEDNFSNLLSTLSKEKGWVPAFSPQTIRHPQTQNSMVVVLTESVFPFTKPERTSKTAEKKEQEDFYGVFNPLALGKGGFASVHPVVCTLKKGADLDSPQWIIKTKPLGNKRVVKTNSTLGPTSKNYNSSLKTLIKEHEIGQYASHMGYRYKTSCPDQKNGFLLMRQLPGVSFETILQARKVDPSLISDRERLIITMNLLSIIDKQTVDYKHPDDQDVYLIHQDIKPHNLLLSKDLTVNLIDYGLAAWSNRIFNEELAGTALFVDPLLWDDQNLNPSTDSDHFSLARVIAELWGDTSSDDARNLSDFISMRRRNSIHNLLEGVSLFSEDDKRLIKEIIISLNQYESNKRTGLRAALNQFADILKRYPALSSDTTPSKLAAFIDGLNKKQQNQETMAQYKAQQLSALNHAAIIKQNTMVSELNASSLERYKSASFKTQVRSCIKQATNSKEKIYAPHGIIQKAHRVVTSNRVVEEKLTALQPLDTIPARLSLLEGLKNRVNSLYMNPTIELEALVQSAQDLSVEMEQFEVTDKLVLVLKRQISNLNLVDAQQFSFNLFYKVEFSSLLPDLVTLLGRVNRTSLASDPLKDKMIALLRQLEVADQEQLSSLHKDILGYNNIFELFVWIGQSNATSDKFSRGLRVKLFDEKQAPFDFKYWNRYRVCELDFFNRIPTTANLSEQLYLLFQERSCDSVASYKKLEVIFQRTEHCLLLNEEKYSALIHLILKNNDPVVLNKFRAIMWDFLNTEHCNAVLKQGLYRNLLELKPQNFGIFGNFFKSIEAVMNGVLCIGAVRATNSTAPNS